MQKTGISKNTSISLIVNGERKVVRATTPRELLTELELEGDFFAIAINRHVVTRSRWNESLFRDGDNVEIVTPRQGG